MSTATARGAAAARDAPPDPPPDCPICPRLVAYREANAAKEPDWFNGAVPSFGPEDARLLVVGLAPGVGGANRTGRPFTGDYAGDLLYQTLFAFGFSTGTYAARPDDGVALHDVMITNAVRCVPPQNKPVGAEITSCRPFLGARISGLSRLRAILALGRIAHDATLRALGHRVAAHPFAHAARHRLDPAAASQPAAAPLLLIDSYHCSRYNTNTGRLTRMMFRDVFASIRAELGPPSPDAGRPRLM